MDDRYAFSNKNALVWMGPYDCRGQVQQIEQQVQL